MIQKHSKFLFILWSFVIVSFLFFQNFTQDVSSKAVHNEACQQAFDLNQSRLLNVNRLQADLLAAWPRDVQSPQNSLNALASVMMDANQKIYGACLVQESEVQASHQLALGELKKLALVDSNQVWKNYLAGLESTISTLKEITR
jgi:hypothetical protein